MYSISFPTCGCGKSEKIIPSSHALNEMVWVSAAKTSKELPLEFTAKPNIWEIIILTAYCWTDCCAGMKLDHKLCQWLFGWHNTSRIWDLGFFPGNTLNPRINFSFRKNFSSRDICTKYFEVEVSGIISSGGVKVTDMVFFWLICFFFGLILNFEKPYQSKLSLISVRI